MAEFDPKTQFQGNIKPYLKKIKQRINQVEAAAGSITGTFRGAEDTINLIQTNHPTAKAGDWAILKKDDGENESGIYVKDASGWVFVQDITNFEEIVLSIIATDTEFNEGTKEGKAANVKQVKDALTALDEAKAEKGGLATQSFIAKAGEEGTDQVVTVNQMTFAITDAEAESDYNNA